MKLTKNLNIMMMSFLLVACGGGGGSSTPKTTVNVTSEGTGTSENTAPTTPVDNVPQEPDPNAIYDTTAELVVSRTFLISQEYKLEISYGNKNDRRVYLSICTDFNEGASGITVNYNSCLLRASIETDYTGSLSVANDKTRLVMAIWYLDDIDTPRYEIWENNNNVEEVKRFDVN